jgi:hypothetical protein
MNRSIAAAAVIAAGVLFESHAGPVAAGQSDLDAFMQQVLARRDDNWKKLQQYILDERQHIELRGPAHISLWGERRDYTWYIRDGFFVRSPIKVNGVAIGEADRRKYEADYLQRMQRRDKPSTPSETPPVEVPTDVAALIRQTRQPEFISSAYFLRFKFDAGTYALVGRERLEDRDVLRIEYYPTKLFSGGQERREGREGREGQEGQKRRDREEDAQFNKLMNKVALVTLWIEPTSHQIVKYTYDNVALDFLPAQWLVHVNDIRASMTMGQPFPDVWLPRALEMNAALAFAIGQVDVRVALDYHDYRQPDVTSKVGIKEK